MILMLNRTRLLLCILLFLIAGVALAWASELTEHNTQIEDSGTRRIKAVRTTEEIRIDGVLNETAWNQAAPASGFRQQEPSEGASATEQTEVRVLYDDKHLYLGIRAHDSEPDKIN